MTSVWTSDVHPLDVEAFARVLDDHDVEYVIVGGLAAIAHGYSGATLDIDAVPALEPENLERLGAALRTLDARLYADPERRDLRDDGSPPEVDDFVLDAEGLQRRLVWHFSTAVGLVDVLLVVDGPGGYRELVRRADTRDVGGRPVAIASLHDLIDSKETAGRAKDLRALPELRALLAVKQQRAE